MLQIGAIEGVLDGHQNAVAAERFFEEIESSGAGGFDGIGDGAVAGNHDDGRGCHVLPDGAQQVDAVAIGQLHIEEVGVGATAVGMPVEVRHGAANIDGIAFPLQDQTQGAADILFVIHDQKAFGYHWLRLGAARGNRRRPALLSLPQCPRPTAARWKGPAPCLSF